MKVSHLASLMLNLFLAIYGSLIVGLFLSSDRIECKSSRREADNIDVLRCLGRMDSFVNKNVVPLILCSILLPISASILALKYPLNRGGGLKVGLPASLFLNICGAILCFIIYFLLQEKFYCSLHQVTPKGFNKETFLCHLSTFTLLRSTQIGGFIIISVNLILCLVVQNMRRRRAKKASEDIENSKPFDSKGSKLGGSNQKRNVKDQVKKAWQNKQILELEVGLECDKRGAEHGINLERLRELEAKLEEVSKAKDKVVEESKLLQEKTLEAVREVEAVKLNAQHEVDTVNVKLEAEKTELQSRLTLHQENLAVLTNDKEELTVKLEEAQKSLEASEEEVEKKTANLEGELESLKATSSGLEATLKEKSDVMSEQEEKLSSLERNLSDAMDAKNKLENTNRYLEEKLREEMRVKNELVTSTSMLITDTISLKNSIRDCEAKHETEKAKLAAQIDEKKREISEFESRLNDKVTLDNDLRIASKKNKEKDALIKKLKEDNEGLRKELATLEIKLTDLKQGNNGEDIKDAMKNQKLKFEENHKKIIDNLHEKYKAKCADIISGSQKIVDEDKKTIKKLEEEKKKLDEELLDALAKAELYKKKLLEFSAKLEEDEMLTKTESNLREVPKLKAENKNLTNMLNFAETKLREQNKLDYRPATRSRDSRYTSGSSESISGFN